MAKLSLKNQKTNIVVTAIILAIALVVGSIVAVDFVSFRQYNAYFNTDLVDEIQHFVDYSPNLKGTVGADTAIYIKYGSKNTVALIKAENADQLNTLDSLNATGKHICGITGSESLTIAKASLTTVNEVADVVAAAAAVKAGTADAAVMTYAEAKAAVAADSSLAVSKAEVEKVPSMLVLGGTHPNEPAGQIAATIILESATVERGILYIVTETNRSGYTHTHPQEASPEYYHLTAKDGSQRTFKFGSRASNTVDQWPTPDMYSHKQSGQTLSASEVRNLNRAYPGSVDGNYTERVAYAVTQIIRQNNISIAIDLHEASPEYSNINQGVYHQAAESITGEASLLAEMAGIDTLNFSQSPINFHGLTHRELGDYTNALVYLFETSNASQGKYRGPFTEDLIVTGKDKLYDIAEEAGLLYAPPVHIDERAARHVCCVDVLAQAFNNASGLTRESYDGTSIVDYSVLGDFSISMPSYMDIYTNGAGYYLAPAK